MKIKDSAARIDEIIPLKLAQDWDNVGLLIGDSQKDVKNILLTIDITRDIDSQQDIFDILLRITDQQPYVVPVLRQLERDYFIDSRGNIFYLHLFFSHSLFTSRSKLVCSFLVTSPTRPSPTVLLSTLV